MLYETGDFRASGHRTHIGKAEKLNFWRLWGGAHRVWSLNAWLGLSDLASKGFSSFCGDSGGNLRVLGPWVAHMAGLR